MINREADYANLHSLPLFAVSPDGFWWNNGQRDHVLVSGSTNNGSKCGASYLSFDRPAGYWYWSIGVSGIYRSNFPSSDVYSIICTGGWYSTSISDIIMSSKEKITGLRIIKPKTIWCILTPDVFKMSNGYEKVGALVGGGHKEDYYRQVGMSALHLAIGYSWRYWYVGGTRCTLVCRRYYQSIFTSRRKKFWVRIPRIGWYALHIS